MNSRPSKEIDFYSDDFLSKICIWTKLSFYYLKK